MEKICNSSRNLSWLIVALAFFLRLYGLDGKPFHEDEGWTLNHILHLSYSQLLFEQYELLNPPLYYLLVKGISQCLGVSEFSLRFLSVISSTLGIWLIYKAGSLCKSEKAGLMAATLLAISPLSIVYAQVARTHGLFSLWAILSFVLLIRYFQTRNTIFFLAFFACAFLGIATHFLFSILLLTDSFFFILQSRKMGRREAVKWFGACLILFLIFLQSLLVAFPQWYHFESTVNPVSLWVRTLISFFGLVLGETTYPFNWPVVLPAAFFFGTAFGIGVYSCVRHPEKCNRLLLLRFLFPLAVWLYMGDEGPRHLSYALPFFILIAAFGVEALSIKGVWKAAWFFFLMIPQGISSYYWLSSNPNQIINSNLIIPWKEIALDIQSGRKADETILVHPSNHDYLIQYYMPEIYSLARGEPALAKVRGSVLTLHPDNPHPDFISLPEGNYDGKLKEILKMHPPSLWLLTPPNTAREKKIRMEYFSCYQPVYHKGYVLNPVLREHFQTGKMRLSYAAELRYLKRIQNCEESP